MFLKMASSFQYLSIIMTNKSTSEWPSLVKWAATGDSFIYATMADVETVAVHSRVEGLSGFANILETTPPVLY